jgi:hypothetical protein
MLSEDVTLCAACGSPVTAAVAVLYDYRVYCGPCFVRRIHEPVRAPVPAARPRRPSDPHRERTRAEVDTFS